SSCVLRALHSFPTRRSSDLFFISLAVIIVSMNTGGVHPTKGFALLLGLYGFWILIYGVVLNFKPSVIGAYVVFAFALASLFVAQDRKSTRLNSSHVKISYAV